MIRSALRGAAVCLLLSCSHLGGRTAKTEYIREDYRERIGRVHFVLDEITVDRGTESGRIRSNGEHILRVLFEHRRTGEKNPAGLLSARVRLKEESFIRDYRTVNAVTAEVALYETGPDRSAAESPAALALYSEDTEETPSSYAYLYGLLSKAFERLR